MVEKKFVCHLNKSLLSNINIADLFVSFLTGSVLNIRGDAINTVIEGQYYIIEDLIEELKKVDNSLDMILGRKNAWSFNRYNAFRSAIYNASVIEKSIDFIMNKTKDMHSVDKVVIEIQIPKDWMNNSDQDKNQTTGIQFIKDYFKDYIIFKEY